MTPLVSILIPAYNAQAHIGNTLQSALAQSWPRKEVIIVDDGSTDATRDVVASFKSSSLKLVRQGNQGAATARNCALEQAQGDFIQWLDADDLLSVDKIAQQVVLLRAAADPAMVASCGWGYFRSRPHAARFAPGPLWADLDPVEWMLRKWETNSHMQTATWLVSRALTDSAGPWNTTLSNDDDGEYFSRVVARSTGIQFVSAARVYYRVSPPGRLSYLGGSARKLDAMYRGMKLQIELLLSLRDDPRTRKACATYIETWLPEFDGYRDDLAAQLKYLAGSLGYDVASPPVSWKYRWIAQVAGQGRARRVQLRYNHAKASLVRKWDRLRLLAEGGTVEIEKL